MLLFLIFTSKLGKCPEFLGGSRRSVIQLVQQDLLVRVKEVRAEARYGCSGAANIVSAIRVTGGKDEGDLRGLLLRLRHGDENQIENWIWRFGVKS